jgi:hypothetical protein
LGRARVRVGVGVRHAAAIGATHHHSATPPAE